MNNEYLRLLQEAMLRELGSAIKLHNEQFDMEKCTSVNVFANIEYIYDEIEEKEFGEPTGSKMKFMPKRYKEMVMRLISPECAFSYKKTETDFSVCIEAFLFLNREDNKPISAGVSVVSYQSFSDSSMDELTCKRMAESVARGQAESKALQKFGIGSWFRYEFEEENPEVMLEQEKQKNSFQPAHMPVDFNEASISTTVETESESVTPDNPDIPKEEPVKEEPVSENPENEKSEEEDSEKLDDKSENATVDTDETIKAARATVCTVGKAKGMTLGEIEEKYPANLIWQYLQKECDYKDALRIIILANSSLNDYAKERGLQL